MATDANHLIQGSDVLHSHGVLSRRVFQSQQKPLNPMLASDVILGTATSIPKFLETYVPTLFEQNHEHCILTSNIGVDRVNLSAQQLRHILIRPTSSTLEPLRRLRTLQSQSLLSLVDDCVWTLVQRRCSTSQRGGSGLSSMESSLSCVVERNNTNNILCQGYTMTETSDSGRLSQRQLNAAKEYIATHFVELHSTVGDDVMRYVLLNSSIFVRLPNDNHWQVAGPPFQSMAHAKDNSKDKCSMADSRKRKRKRPISSLKELGSDDHALSPHACIYRKPLFYSHSYTKTIRFRLSETTQANLFHSMTREYQDIVSKLTGPNDDVSLTLLGDVLRRSRTMDYARKVQKHCPLPKNYVEAALADLSHMYTSQERVVAFCQDCVACMFPPNFWGWSSQQQRSCRRRRDQCNAAVISESVRLFCSMRRNERLTNKTLMHNFATTKMSWVEPPLSSRVDHEKRKLLVLCMVRWVFQSVLIPLLQQVFYVTESEFHANRVLYYRKPVWSLFRALSMKKLASPKDRITLSISSLLYTELSEVQTAERLSNKTMGLSRLRLLPKSTGVRPIATLSKNEQMLVLVSDSRKTTDHNSTPAGVNEEVMGTPFGPARPLTEDEVRKKCEKAPVQTPHHQVKAPNQSKLPPNALLGNVQAVLNYEYTRNQALFGSGIMGLHHLYPRYRNFVQLWKNDNADATFEKPLYFGSVDIRHCYDSINQEHLLSLIDKIMVTSDYVIETYSVSSSTNTLGLEKVRRHVQREVSLPEELSPFYSKVRCLAKEYHGCVFVDGVNAMSISKQQIMNQLTEHLKSNMVVTKGRYGSRYLVQSLGIPQGSVVSSMLCNIYYGDVEKVMLGDRKKLSENTKNDSSNELLVRMVDDFFFVTTQSADLRQFFATMYRGKPDLGVEINKEKTSSSIPLTIPIDSADDASLTVDGTTVIFFAWCGMLFHTKTGDVRIDYSRFHGGKGADSLTMTYGVQEGLNLSTQMIQFVRPRCIPILFDGSINSMETQCVNFSQLMVYGAVKTVEYLICCAHSSSSSLNGLVNPSFVMGCIQNTIEMAYKLISRRLAKARQEFPSSEAADTTQSTTNKNAFTRRNAVWLGWHAFYVVFQSVGGSMFRTFAATHLSTKVDDPQHSGSGDDKRQFRYLQRVASKAVHDIELEKLLPVTGS